MTDVLQRSDRNTIRVDLGPRAYEITIVTQGDDRWITALRTALSASADAQAARRFLLFVCDERIENLARSYFDRAVSAGFPGDLITVPSGEASKSWEQLMPLLDRLVAHHADRRTCVVAVGGGVIGDLAGFAAATYARGIALFMMPTTLLSQVDSSVGGKVGINHSQAKNIFGAFHQPIGVWIDTAFLSSLPEREFRAGMAEVIKYGVILDAELFRYLEREREKIQTLDPGAIRHIVSRSCRLKADIVEQDEREETGLRAVLNFGHTVGHAIEAVAGYGQYLHGEAVALGMIAESHLALQVGWVSQPWVDRVRTLIADYGLPTRLDSCDCEPLITAMAIDKKNRDGKIRFVLPHDLARMELTSAPTLDQVRSALEYLGR